MGSDPSLPESVQPEWEEGLPSDPLDRLRRVLDALNGPLHLNGRDGVILDRHARCVARAPLLSQNARGGRAEAEAIAALGTLHPALLAVVEAARALGGLEGCCIENSDQYDRMLASLDALDVAITRHMEEP